MRGDTVPGLGRIDSIVRWATVRSWQRLIATPMNGAPEFSCCFLQRIRSFEFVADQLFIELSLCF